jgi:Fic family protein
MVWNWQKKEWPDFSFDQTFFQELLDEFYLLAGELQGASRLFSNLEKENLTFEIITDEALKTSEIEGEYFNRESVQSSIQRQFGLKVDGRKPSPGEFGIAELMVDLYHSILQPLSHEQLFRWHSMLTNGRRDLVDIGRYRTSPEPMQVVSGPMGRPIIHFEGPASAQVPAEMERFITWFGDTSKSGSMPLHPVVRSGIAHLYFVSIHPFEDGNGRIGRAIAEKALSEGLGFPSLIALSHTIEKHKKRYYDSLAKNNQGLEITEWLSYFAETVILAQKRSNAMVDFIIAKTRLYDRIKDQLNERQTKVLERVFREGPEGFQGGLSLQNYLSITGTSRATATRDLKDLVEMGVMSKTGDLKGTRYFLKLGG